MDGYEIQRTILFETGYGFALGCERGTLEKFAVWNFTETACGRDCYWKSCHENRDAAEENFQKRAGRWRMMYGMQEKTKDSTAVFYRYYATERPVDIATFPQPEENSPVMLVNYNEGRRRLVAGGRLCAWSEILYPHPLTKEQMEDYELKPAPDNL
ncbi:defense against restriction DarA-related protein [Parablautia muri]|nr:hypothetical protein [Parablautia muri]